jgi:hypothetical protein
MTKAEASINDDIEFPADAVKAAVIASARRKAAEAMRERIARLADAREGNRIEGFARIIRAVEWEG